MSSYVIIGVHGLSNKPDKDTLAGWWHDSIVEGLQVNRSFKGDDVNFRSVHWADVMYPTPDPVPDAYAKAAPGALQRYRDSWIDYLRGQALGVIGEAIDGMKDMFGLSEVAEHVLKEKLPDLHKYYEDAAIREELRGRLRDAIMDSRDQRIMVVAHSMGSIIAYDTLRELGRKEPNLAIDHFITIGSPLGLPHVKYKILQESPIIRTPSIVKRWSNFADRRDPVAADIYLKDDYEANCHGVRVVDDLIMNDWGKKIYHKSYGYLRCPEFSDAVYNFV